MASWRLLLLIAATAAASDNIPTTIQLLDIRMSPSLSLKSGAFVSTIINNCNTKKNNLPPPHCPNMPSTLVVSSLQSTAFPLLMSKTSMQSLQDKILEGATLKLQNKEYSYDNNKQMPMPIDEANNIDKEEETQKYTYYIRKGQRSEIDEITEALMDSFHPNSRPTFDSYIRRYKYNHLKMQFDAIEECDRGLFVACAVPGSSSSSVQEKIVGFCSVDGRAPDPSCKVEFLTPSTLAGTSPRPYLSDLGVSTKHRRRGIGEKLVYACEQWTYNRGYKQLYLKVEKENKGAVSLYSNMGYSKTKLPWGYQVSNTEGNRWDTTLLMEKNIDETIQKKQKRKRTWLKKQLWQPIKNSVSFTTLVNEK